MLPGWPIPNLLKALGLFFPGCCFVPVLISYYMMFVLQSIHFLLTLSFTRVCTGVLSHFFWVHEMGQNGEREKNRECQSGESLTLSVYCWSRRIPSGIEAPQLDHVVNTSGGNNLIVTGNLMSSSKLSCFLASQVNEFHHQFFHNAP